MIRRGEIWWADLPDPEGSGPGYRRPVLVVQSDDFNRGRIATVIVAVLTSNLALADAPGNVRLAARVSRLPRDAVVNVSQLVTLDKALLTERVGLLHERHLIPVEIGLRLVLSLGLGP